MKKEKEKFVIDVSFNHPNEKEDFINAWAELLASYIKEKRTANEKEAAS